MSYHGMPCPAPAWLTPGASARATTPPSSRWSPTNRSRWRTTVGDCRTWRRLDHVNIEVQTCTH